MRLTSTRRFRLATLALLAAGVPDSVAAAAPATAQVGAIDPAPSAGVQNGADVAELPAELRAIVGHPSLDGATIGMQVVDVGSGEALLAHNIDELFAPASVNKLFTAATALWRLGPAFQWQTPLATTAERGGERDEILAGDLWALGRGAPDIVEEQIFVAARAIRALGIERVQGDIVVEDGFFDDQRFGQGWPGGAQVREAYHAPIGALMANYSAYRDGDEWVAVRDPAAHFGARLVELLEFAGVAVDGIVRRPTAAEIETVAAPDLDPGNARIGLPAGFRLLYTIRSEPLVRLVQDLNKFSNNVMAETMLKTLGAVEYGHPGTATKGLAVAARFRNEVLGSELTDYVQADGSGLSRFNRMSPRQVVHLLQTAYHDFHLGPEFVASMKISGRDGFNPGAFRRPPLLDKMRVKSGHIRGVNTLCGYAHTDAERVVAFCLMINGHRSQQWQVDERMAELSRIILSIF